MAIYIHCPNCNERLEDMRPDCTHCGVDLPPGVLYALASALGKAPMSSPTTMAGHIPAHLTQSPTPSASSVIEETPPAQSSTLRPWLAATLSLLCGLGQLYNGQIAKGMVLIVLGAAAIVSIQLPIGKIMAPLVWLYAIVDAYLVARRTVES
jgi:TM2 domain-containing membrane protein YozV